MWKVFYLFLLKSTILDASPVFEYAFNPFFMFEIFELIKPKEKPLKNKLQIKFKNSKINQVRFEIKV